MTDNITKRQHHVPQFHLRQFATPRNNEYYIWCYDKKNNNIFESNVKNVGVENWFYDKQFYGDNVFEKALSILEGHFSKIYRIIQETTISELTTEEKQIIGELVYILDTRTRKARENTIRVNENVINRTNFNDWFQNEFPGITIEEHLEDIKRNIQLSEMFDIEIEYNKAKFSETLDRIMEFDLFLLENDIRITNMEFYKSDHPVCHFNLSEGIDIKIILPITPEKCLMFTNNKHWESDNPSHQVSINKKFIQITNERTVKKANKYTFSKTNDFSFAKLIITKNND